MGLLHAYLRQRDRSIFRDALILLAVIIAFLSIGKYWPVGPDYFFTFRPIAESFLRGETRLYDQSSPGYFNAPWGIFLIFPTLLFPIPYGQALITMVTFAGFILAIHALASGEKGKRSWLPATFLAIANLHTFDLLIRGNLEGFLLLGLALGWIGYDRRKPLIMGAGLWLLSVKPLNVLLPAILMLWLIRRWSKRELGICFAPLAGSLLLSFALSGTDWPLRYLQFASNAPPLTYLQTSLWRAFSYFGYPPATAYLAGLLILVAILIGIRRPLAGEQHRLMALCLAANLTITPYALGSHYVLLAPAFALLAGRSKWLLGLWAFTLTPLLRLIWDFDVAWMDISYPLALLIAAAGMIWKERSCGGGNLPPDQLMHITLPG